jgi:hypothetical protein
VTAPRDVPQAIRWLAKERRLRPRHVRGDRRAVREGSRTVHLGSVVTDHVAGRLRFGLGSRSLFWRREPDE